MAAPMLHPQIDPYLHKVDAFMAKYPTLTQHDRLRSLEQQTGYPKVYFFIVFAILFKVLVFVIGGAKLVVDLVGFTYPAYMSFKSMDTLSSEEASRQWLTYWVVFASLALMEQMAKFLVAWIPFYYYMKICFLVWLYHPKFLGAQTIYSQVIRPLILPYMEMASSSTAPATKTTTKKVE